MPLSPTTLAKLHTLMLEYVPHQIPAVALSVWDRDGERATHTWGVIDPDTQQVPVTPDTLFDLASVTKIYVTTALLMLMGQGKVGLDDALVTVIPEFGGAPRPIDGGQDPHTKQPLATPSELNGQLADPNAITFRHLLTHTSGIAPWRDVYNRAGTTPPPPQENDPINKHTRWERAIAAICEYPFVGHPDGVIRYSDLGLMLLGECVARLVGQPLDEALATLLSPTIDPMPVFNPVREHGIALERIAPTEDDPTWRKRRVWGEVHDENTCGVGGVSGHAGYFANVGSVAQLGHRWLTRTLPIPNDLMTLATTPQAVNGNERRGLGWMMKSIVGSSAGDLFPPETYGHTGFVGTSLYVDPVNGYVISLLTNAVYYGRDIMSSFEFRRAVHTLLAEELLS
jgi:CubicO group peptidase (beta-lactamase class C family)